jgi:hypothetical protein
MAKFYKALHETVEDLGHGYTNSNTIRARRDKALRDYYQAELAEYIQRQSEWRSAPDPEWSEVDKEYRRLDRARLDHEYVVSSIASATDLRKDVVERAVGQSSKEYWEKIHKAYAKVEEEEAKEAQGTTTPEREITSADR